VSSTTINPIADAAAMMFACMRASDLLCEARHDPLLKSHLVVRSSPKTGQLQLLLLTAVMAFECHAPKE